MTSPSPQDAPRASEPAVVLLFDPRQPGNHRATRTFYVGSDSNDLAHVPQALFEDIRDGMHDGQPPTGLLCASTGIHVLDPVLQEIWRTREAFALRDVVKNGQRYTPEGRVIQDDAWTVIQAQWAEHLEGVLR